MIMVKPTKQEMNQLAARLTRKKFACKVETQGTEHIVRCNWDQPEELDDGKIITASVIPKTLQGSEVLDVIIDIGMGQGLPRNEEQLKAQFATAQQELNPLMNAKGFDLNNRVKQGNFPISIRGTKRVSHITDADIEDVNAFINLYASKFHSEDKSRYGFGYSSREKHGFGY